MKKLLLFILLSTLAFSQAPNLFSTYLTTGVSSTDTVFTFTASDSSFAGSGVSYNATIYDTWYANASEAYKAGKAEIVLINTRSGRTFNVTRAQFGTTARSFNTSGRRYKIVVDVYSNDFDGFSDSVSAHRIFINANRDSIASHRSSLSVLTDSSKSVYTMKTNNNQTISGTKTFTAGVWQGSSIDTTYTNSVSKITGGTGITATKNAKDYTITASISQILTSALSGTIGSGGDVYGTFGSIGVLATDLIKFVAPKAFTMGRLFVSNQSTNATNAQRAFVCVLKNGASGSDSLKAFVVSGQTSSDTTSTISFAQGDLVSIWWCVGNGLVANVSASVVIY